jgi:hypothetical protein
VDRWTLFPPSRDAARSTLDPDALWPNKEEWLRHRLEKHQNIGVDPTLISIGKRGEEGVIVTNISQSLVNVCLFIRGCYEHSKSIGGVFITARIRC